MLKEDVETCNTKAKKKPDKQLPACRYVRSYTDLFAMSLLINDPTRPVTAAYAVSEQFLSKCWRNEK